MPVFKKTYAGLAVVSLLAAPTAFAYGDFNARLDCLSKVAPYGSEYSGPQDVRSEETGQNSS